MASELEDSSMTGAPVAPVAVLPSRFARVIEDQEKSISLFLIEENAVRVTTGERARSRSRRRRRSRCDCRSGSGTGAHLDGPGRVRDLHARQEPSRQRTGW